MITALKFVRNSILKYQYGQTKGWTYSIEDNVWFYDGITTSEPDYLDLVYDIPFDGNQVKA